MNVLVAMSGGVDSSVAAALLAEEGHDVTGVTMRLWGGDSDSGCCSVSDVDDARRVAQQLGIDHHVFNFTDDFQREVVDPYVAAHTVGVTPNPCIECNRHLKFDRLLARARLLGFDAVATGHHARIARHGGGWRVERGADRDKDQSYVVHMLDQATMATTLFPVGELTKAQVRDRATAMGLRTAEKPDSQDVCFITHTGGRSAFLGSRIPMRSGRVVDRTGTQLGTVDAVELVTVGQRRGLALTGAPERQFVLDVDLVSATVVVGSTADTLVTGEHVGALTLADGSLDGAVDVDVFVQCSAHGAPRPARLTMEGDTASVRWHEPQRRVAPGQSAVFYDTADRFVLGGGLVMAKSA